MQSDMGLTTLTETKGGPRPHSGKNKIARDASTTMTRKEQLTPRGHEARGRREGLQQSAA